MKVSKLLLLLALGAVLAPGRLSATTVFLDTFTNGSTVNSATYANPTANSASYEVAASKSISSPNNPTVAANDLRVAMAASTSGFVQLQALFTNSPIVLANSGDFVTLTFTFTDTANVISSSAALTNTSASFDFGLYNGNQINPVVGGMNGNATTTALANTGSNHVTDGVSGWVGYAQQIFYTGGSNGKVVTRPAQTSANNTNQDLLFNGASAAQTYNSPVGVQVGATGAGTQVALTNSSVYTEQFTITNTGAGTQSFAHSLYAGNTATGTPISTMTTSTTGSPANQFVTNTFDGLAVGWRSSFTTTGSATAIDISSIQIDTNTVVTVPEPGSIALLGAGLAGMVLAIRRRK